MKVDFKKLTASALSVAVLASLSGCAMFDKDDEAVLKVAVCQRSVSHSGQSVIVTSVVSTELTT